MVANLFRKDCDLVEKRFGLAIETHGEMIEGTFSPDLDNLSGDCNLIKSKAKKGGNLAMLMYRLIKVFGS